MKTKPLGYIAYEGRSRIDGSPIVVIINRIDTDSANDKTGSLIQSFILRSDIPPLEAIHTGADRAICGDCEHRPLIAKQTGKAPCYVAVWQAPRAVFAAYKAGRYEKATPKQIGRIIAGRKLRIGTYGDGAAAPVEIWEDMTEFTAGHTGYSHQWKRPDFDHARWSRLVMASADSIDDAALANLYGMRVFRVSVGVDKQPAETVCPASAEAGKRTTCEKCLLCAGTSNTARDIVIADHATGYRRRVIQLQAA